MSDSAEETSETQLISRLQPLENIIQDLQSRGGREFEESVCNALNFLDLEAFLTASTEAESDVVAEALHAEIPFFIVVECQAVREGSQVGVNKLGQIRGNASSYLDTRRQQLFKIGYKLIVGKPEFSNNARKRAPPDVALMSVDPLILLLKLHNRYQFSQNELHNIFQRVGEIKRSDISKLAAQSFAERQYVRKLSIYSLVYVALLEDPYIVKLEKRKGWSLLGEIVGEVLAYGNLFRIRGLTSDEVIQRVRDLDNPFMRIVEMKGEVVRLSTVSKSVVEEFSPFGKALVSDINEKLRKLRGLARAISDSN